MEVERTMMMKSLGKTENPERSTEKVSHLKFTTPLPLSENLFFNGKFFRSSNNHFIRQFFFKMSLGPNVSSCLQ